MTTPNSIFIYSFAGQRKLKLDGPQTAKMVQESARGPAEHQQLVTEFRQSLSKLQNDPTCRAFKVKPAETPTMVRSWTSDGKRK